jgi:glyoxylate utilization-related uncharacterized protein
MFSKIVKKSFLNIWKMQKMGISLQPLSGMGATFYEEMATVFG